MIEKPGRRRLLLAGAFGAAGATVVGLIFGLGPKLGGEDAPADKAPETTMDVLNRQLDVASLAGPVATKWAACPVGEGAETLPASVQVTARYVYKVPREGLLTPTVTIASVVRYRNLAGQVIAYCGRSTGVSQTDTINRPPKDQVVVIPRTDFDCPDTILRPGQVVPCPDEPVIYDTQPGGSRIPLGNPPSTLQA